MAPESKAGDIGSVLNAVKEATEAMVSKRAEADAKAADAIQVMERSLALVLRGEVLRGLPDLGGRTFGLRIGVEGSAFAKLVPGKPTLILDAHGMLVVATLLPNGTTFAQKAPHSFARASILVPYVRAVQQALEGHRRSAASRTGQFQRISALSTRIAEAVRAERFSSAAPA